MWNDDYFEFLVKYVWKIDKPINIVDFGCGYGFLGIKLLPLLAQGSSYTGIDKGKELLIEASNLFGSSPYHTHFVEADLTEYVAEQRYDLAICQAVLRHIPSPENVLKKMIDSVVPGGKVICIEVNRAMEEAGFFSSDYTHDRIQETIKIKQQWHAEQESGGRDYKTGIKIPMYMEKMGLIDVGARVNDFVEHISPLSNRQAYDSDILLSLQSRGFATDHGDNTHVVSARCLIISCGTKPFAQC